MPLKSNEWCVPFFNVELASIGFGALLNIFQLYRIIVLTLGKVAYELCLGIEMLGTHASLTLRGNLDYPIKTFNSQFQI